MPGQRETIPARMTVVLARLLGFIGLNRLTSTEFTLGRVVEQALLGSADKATSSAEPNGGDKGVEGEDGPNSELGRTAIGLLSAAWLVIGAAILIVVLLATDASVARGLGKIIYQGSTFAVALSCVNAAFIYFVGRGSFLSFRPAVANFLWLTSVIVFWGVFLLPSLVPMP